MSLSSIFLLGKSDSLNYLKLLNLLKDFSYFLGVFLNICLIYISRFGPPTVFVSTFDLKLTLYPICIIYSECTTRNISHKNLLIKCFLNSVIKSLIFYAGCINFFVPLSGKILLNTSNSSWFSCENNQSFNFCPFFPNVLSFC